MRSVVIPTRFNRDTLAPLVDACKKVAQVVLVHTEPGHEDVPGTVTVRNYERNIHTWWNVGLNQCDGPTLILNDDITATPDALTALFDALDSADLVYLDGKRGRTPLSGWCYGIHPDGRLRPDESFTWWFGDDDIWQRAQRQNATVTVLDLPQIRHVSRSTAFEDPKMQEAAGWDRALYLRRWS